MAYYGINVNMESVSATTATPSVELGTYRIDTGYEYVYAYNGGNTVVIPGDCVYLGSTSSYTSSYTFEATNAASQVGIVAGGVHHATIATAYYGWIMTKGCCRVRPDTSAVQFHAGNYLVPGVNNGWVAITGATISTAHRVGICINSGVTHEGASLASCGKAWIRSDCW